EAELCTVVTTNGRHDDNGVNESGKRCQWSTKFHLMSVRPRAADPAPPGNGRPTCGDLDGAKVCVAAIHRESRRRCRRLVGRGTLCAGVNRSATERVR